MRPKKLVFVNTPSVGREIKADIGETIFCGEYTMKATEQVIASSPWIQFPPDKWNNMIDEVYQEMVDLWNEKYGSY